MKSNYMLPLNIQLFAEEPSGAIVGPAEPQPTPEPTEVIDAPAEPVTPQPTNEPVKPVQSQEENRLAAAARREAEAKARQVEAENKRLLQALNQFGYEGSAIEIADLLESQQTQKPIEQVRAEREYLEQQQAKETQLQSEISELRNFKYSKIIEQDIAEINKAYPGANIKSVQDLGTDYLNIMRLGQVDCVTAYDILQARKAKSDVAKPPTTGAVNSQSTQEKDIYTVEEVRQMTPAQVKKNFERIQKSMPTWRK